MVIDFYTNFYKRINSTLRPTVGGAGNLTAVHEMTGTLKEPCSITHPVISIAGTPVESTIPAVCTYAYIPKFFRYYFVKDWVWKDGLWEVHLDVDVLATYKTHIGDTEAYVERSASMSSPYITDKMYPATNEPSISDVFINAPWTNKTPSQGCYVLGVISGASSTTTGSAVTYYALTFAQMEGLVNYLLSDQFITDAGFPTTLNTEPISHNTAKSILNPMQYIVSCIWLPKTATSIGESTARQIRVGYYAVPTTIATGYWISDTLVQFNCSCSIPSHPQASTRGAYMNYAPFTKLMCFIPPFGEFPIDTHYFDTDDVIYFDVYVDIVTGKATLRVSKQNTNSQKWNIYETSAMFGVPIQLAQVSNDLLKTAVSTVNAIGSTVGAIGQALSKNPLGALGAVNTGLMALNSVGNAMESLLPSVISEGANGSFVAFRQSAWLTVQHLIAVDEDNTELGRPLCKVKKINTLSGFIKCGEATVDYTAYDDELNAIHEMLLSGFFWE